MKRILIDYGHGAETKGKRYTFLDESGEVVEQRLEYEMNRQFTRAVCTHILQHHPDVELYDVLKGRQMTLESLAWERLEIEDVPLYKRTTKANELGGDLYLSIHHNALTAETVGSGQSKASGSFSYVFREGPSDAREMAECLVVRDSRVKARDFYVLRRTTMPAVLWEVSFFDNLQDDLPEDWKQRVDALIAALRGI